MFKGLFKRKFNRKRWERGVDNAWAGIKLHGNPYKYTTTRKIRWRL